MRRFIDLDKMQDQHLDWRQKNFGTAPSWQPLLGVQEEVGELSHAFLKRTQGIRMEEDHDDNIMDAVGDIFLYLMDFCNCENISMHACIMKAWEVVQNRDWRQDSE